jgi:SAM-dependent methyltransferase
VRDGLTGAATGHVYGNRDVPWDAFDPDWYVEHYYARARLSRLSDTPSGQLFGALRRLLATDPMAGGTRMLRQLADYDSNGYDYRSYWAGRGYERWAEERALHRLVPLLGTPQWLADFGGGYGRNAQHYRDRASHYVVADGSATNLRNAAVELRDDIAAGRAFLVRCDLRALPFRPGAFDAALVVRVLHHLADLDQVLPQLAATVADRLLLDVPIKHHVLAQVRGRRAVGGPAPLRTGTSEHPFWTFRLSAIQATLRRCGWRSHPVASVNNLRRWDQRLAPGLVRMLTPAAQLAELGAQRLGRGWWGPSQFLLAHRVRPHWAVVPEVPPGVPALAARMCCPACAGRLAWSPATATCLTCGTRYGCDGAVWQFTVPGRES